MNYREFGDQASKVKLGELGEVCRARESMPHLKKVDFFFQTKPNSRPQTVHKPCFIILLIKLSVQFKDRIPV